MGSSLIKIALTPQKTIGLRLLKDV